MRQFGFPNEVNTPRFTPRHAVFGIANRGEQIACVAVKVGSRSFFDLPGGGVRANEREEQALVREFGEETGLRVRPTAHFGSAMQFFKSSSGDKYVLNSGGVWAVERDGIVPRTEPNHRLVWLDASVAMASLRHESHAWFVMEWLRWRERDQSQYRRADPEDAFRVRRRPAAA